MKKTVILLSALITMAVQAQTTFDIEGHRGGRGLWPENTIYGFIEAVKLGVNTLEMDVVVTKDGQLVLSHEPWMSETFCRDKDGKQLEGDVKQRYNIYKLTYDEVKSFDCGSWGNPKFPGQQKTATNKPLLKDVIDSVENYIRVNKLPRVMYNIETKSTVDGDDSFHPKPAGFSKLLYDMLKAKDIVQYAIVQSFDVRTLQEIKKLDKYVTTALLIADLNNFEKNLKQLGYTPEIYSPNELLVTDKLIKKCHDKNIKIIPWTINDEATMIKFKKMGVDGLITDYPDRAIKVLR